MLKCTRICIRQTRRLRCCCNFPVCFLGPVWSASRAAPVSFWCLFATTVASLYNVCVCRGFAAHCAHSFRFSSVFTGNNAFAWHTNKPTPKLPRESRTRVPTQSTPFLRSYHAHATRMFVCVNVDVCFAFCVNSSPRPRCDFARAADECVLSFACRTQPDRSLPPRTFFLSFSKCNVCRTTQLQVYTTNARMRRSWGPPISRDFFFLHTPTRHSDRTRRPTGKAKKKSSTLYFFLF